MFTQVRGWFVEVDGIRTEFTQTEGYTKAVEFFDNARGSKIVLCRLNGTLLDCRIGETCGTSI